MMNFLTVGKVRQAQRNVDMATNHKTWAARQPLAMRKGKAP